MPIRPENAMRYPKDWKRSIVPRIARRSEGRCECSGQCGLVHDGAPNRSAVFEAQLNGRRLPIGGRCKAENGKPHPVTGSRVVLTVMHLDHTPENCEDENLLHACQQCHNRYDAPTRRQGIRARARAALNIPDMFE